MAKEKRLVYLEYILSDLREFAETAKNEPGDLMKMVVACTDTIIKHLEGFPIADAVEVVHGVWVHHYYDSGEPIDDKWYCSECHMCGGHRRTWYCPNCGAKMDGEKNDDDMS